MAGPQVHGRLVELGGRGRRHRHLAKLRGRLEERRERSCLTKLGGRGRSQRRLAKLHNRLIELGGKGHPHRRLAEPSGKGQSHSRLVEPGEEWQERSSRKRAIAQRFGRMARGALGSGQKQPEALGQKRSREERSLV
ncbi:unnamed protein product [Sphagnum troendelagicum]|uniref:Uncharacterized protein n=1 Tax=Sphagnum troendelagicum TaxID=128251 RepID=A0ABP0UAZ3_9BRYO